MTRMERIAADYGHEILAQNDEGYVARDLAFPRKLGAVYGVSEHDDRPGGLLLNVMNADSLRKWARTFSEAADALDEKRESAPLPSIRRPIQEDNGA